MFLARTPIVATWLWPKRLWRMPTQGEKNMYLTFDDGPTPGVTDWVMEQLDRYEAKGTFFVVGEQVQRHPDLLHKLCQQGHRIGHHSQTHPNGWSLDSQAYLADIAAGMESISAELPPQTPLDLFRPPYGKIRSRDARRLSSPTRIVMWDILAGDWKREMPKEQVLGNVLQNGRPGSIVVLHDSKKAEPHLRHTLPRVLEHFAEQGYQFKKL